MASSSHLKPAEKGSIIVRVITRGIRGMFAKTATVISNDPQKPNVTLSIKAFIKEPAPKIQP